MIQSTGQYTDSYVYGANDAPLELLRQRGSATSRYWYTLDGRGNVVALTDINGVVVDRYAYDPYGENLPEGTSETVPQQLRYASYWFDAALGWYWVGARSYDPEGRWIQPGPSQADGLRTYVYADDDPVDETDALGLGGICDVPLFGGAACAVGALAHGAYDLVAGDDIKTMRFLQPDPSDEDGVHTYAYVDDDPIDWTDPTGLSDDGCNVPVFGYYCARNVRERQYASALAHLHLTIAVLVLPLLPHGDRVDRGNGLTGPEAAATIFAISKGTLVLFGQKRIGPNFSQGGTITELADKLRSGQLSPDDISIKAFVWGPNDRLVTVNNRSLAALSKAGLLPTNVEVLSKDQVPRKVLERLDQETIDTSYKIPGSRIPVTPSIKDLTVLEWIELPYVDEEGRR